MEPRSSLYRLAEKQLGTSLRDYVATRRPAQSWRSIATELTERIGVEISYEALRQWFSDGEEPEAGTGPRAPYPPSQPVTPRPPQPNPPPPPPGPRPSKGSTEDGEAA